MRVMVGILLLCIIPCLAIAQPIEWPDAEGGNGHFYEVVPDQVSWNDARNLAAARVWNELPGHLATLTSAAEDVWCHQQFGVLDHGYIVGGFQAAGSNEPSGGWSWVTDEEWVFSNWGGAEPNDAGGIEDCLIGWFSNGTWNDGRCDEPNPWGYLVEYEPEPVPLPESTWGRIKGLYR